MSTKLLELIGEYFDLGVAEGKEGRDHDTASSEAQKKLLQIQLEIENLKAPPSCGTLILSPDGSAQINFETSFMLVQKQKSFHIVPARD